MTAGKSFVFRFEEVEVREREFTLSKAGEVLPVEPKAFRVLLFLLHHPQKLITKEELLDAVWADAAVTESSLTRSIAKLRRVLGDDFQEPRYIATVATVGYKFVCPVEVLVDTPSGDGAEPAGNSAQAADGTIQAKLSHGAVRSFTWRFLLAGAVLAGALASLIWYLRRPLPPPHISGYTRITHDGHEKVPFGTDGGRIYFDEPTLHKVARVGIRGEEITQLPATGLGYPLGFQDVSPDGSSFLVDTLEDGSPYFYILWNVRIQGGSVRRLGLGTYAAFSPDGTSVAYSTLGGDIYLVQSNGSNARKLVSEGGQVSSPVWSPDGSVIRFFKDDQLWEVSVNGSNSHSLLPGWHDSQSKCCGRWTSDGKFFLFLSLGAYSEGGQIWALDERRRLFRNPPREPVQLTTGPTVWGQPIPGTGGRTFFAEGNNLRGELSRFDAKTNHFLPFLGGISAQGLTFSKDGESVAYVTYPEGILWKANRDGSNPIQLSEPPIDAYMPRWSPDGTQILFSDISSESTIYLVSPQSGIQRRLLPEGSGGQADPDWSPDGHKIVYASGFGGHDQKSVIRIFDLDSSRITTLPGSVGMADPRWSPDGRFIAANFFGLETMYIFDVGAQKWSELKLKFGETFPEWSKDGRYIYYLHLGDNRGVGVYRISVKDGVTEKVADVKDVPNSGWFNQWTGLDPTDAPLLLRDIGSSDIFAITLEEK